MQLAEVERARQAQGPREGPLPLGEGETLGTWMHVRPPPRKAPPRIGPDLGTTRDSRPRDDTEQQVLRTPLPASDAHARRDTVDFGDYRQASHTPSYR